MQIFADVFNIPSVRNEVNGAAGLGSAICVAVAAGVYSSFDEAVANMVRLPPSRIFLAAPKNRFGIWRAAGSRPPDKVLPDGGTVRL